MRRSQGGWRRRARGSVMRAEVSRAPGTWGCDKEFSSSEKQPAFYVPSKGTLGFEWWEVRRTAWISSPFEKHGLNVWAHVWPGASPHCGPQFSFVGRLAQDLCLPRYPGSLQLFIHKLKINHRRGCDSENLLEAMSLMFVHNWVKLLLFLTLLLSPGQATGKYRFTKAELALFHVGLIRL